MIDFKNNNNNNGNNNNNNGNNSFEKNVRNLNNQNLNNKIKRDIFNNKFNKNKNFEFKKFVNSNGVDIKNNKQFNKLNNFDSEKDDQKQIVTKKDIKNINKNERVDYLGFKKYERTYEFKNEKDKTYIFGLGGLEEIGKNCYVVEHNEETIMVDYGVKFPSNDILGINGIIANTDYFKINNRAIDALFITHGHEDHIGGIPYLVQNLNVKAIYAPAMAVELIKRRLTEFKQINYEVNIVVYDDYSKIKTKYFEVDFFRVCHSIPDSYGLCIQTPNGNLMSAGDYRFDFGKETDDTNINKIIEMSNRDIDIFLAESTNSDHSGFSESEDNIIQNVAVLIKNAKGRVFVATFASNLGRIEKIIERALKFNRKICIMGRSMEANIKTSRKLGYLKVSDSDFITAKEILNTPDNEVLVILTGSQGEEMAALNMMAHNKYSKISLKPSDTIIMSSNPIPGNYLSVDNLINQLFKQGVHVITNTQNYKIHSSGHATKQEQQMMIKLISPKYLVPIHGEIKMLRSLKQNCVEIGWNPDNIFILTNGLKLELVNKNLKLTDYCIDARPVYTDKRRISQDLVKLVEERRKLSEEGVFNVLVNLDKTNKKVKKHPTISTRGCFYAKDAITLIGKISHSIKDEIEVFLSKNENYTHSQIKDIISKKIKYFIYKNKKKNPIVLSSIFEN